RIVRRAIRSQDDREISDGNGSRSRRLHSDLQPISSPRLPQRAVVHKKTIDELTVHREYGVTKLHALFFRLGLKIDRAPICVAKIEWRPSVLSRASNQIDGVGHAADEDPD